MIRGLLPLSAAVLFAAMFESADRPSGQLLMVSEDAGAVSTVSLTLADSHTVALADLPGATYPAQADPRGTHALLISAEDLPDGTHRERLWLAPLDGAAARSLTPPAGRIRNPSWAPDGSWIAFESDAMSYRDLFRVSRDGTGLTRLTDAPHGSFEPVISPDGSRIAFGTSRDQNAEIYVMQADGSRPVRLTDSPTDDVHPRWAPDGTLTWLTSRDGRPRVWRMHADGTGAAPVHPQADDAMHLDHAWSPDGRYLAIVRQTGPQDIDLDVVDVQAGLVRTRIDTGRVDEHPSWSPDAHWLAFTASNGTSSQVMLASVGSGRTRPLTPEGGTAWLPRWGAGAP